MFKLFTLFKKKFPLLYKMYQMLFLPSLIKPSEIQNFQIIGQFFLCLTLINIENILFRVPWSSLSLRRYSNAYVKICFLHVLWSRVPCSFWVYSILQIIQKNTFSCSVMLGSALCLRRYFNTYVKQTFSCLVE